VAVSPPVDWSSLTGKPSTFAPSAHTHLKSEITGLNADLSALSSADIAINQRIDYITANLDQAALDSIAEAAASIGSLQTQINGKVPNINTSADPVARAAIELRMEESYGDPALKFAVENDSWQILHPENFREAINAQPAGSYALLVNGKVPAAEIQTTAVRAQIPQDDILFYADGDYNGRTLYRAPSGYTLWFNSGDSTWNISENLLFFEPENILHTSDPDDTQHPWESAWSYDILLATLADFTDRAFQTWANKNELLRVTNRLDSAETSIDGKAPSVHTHPASAITGLSDYIISAAPALSITTTTHVADGLTDTYSADGLVSSDSSHVLVSLNGVTQNPVTDYIVNLGQQRQDRPALRQAGGLP
jgi:hypothetical protein